MIYKTRVKPTCMVIYKRIPTCMRPRRRLLATLNRGQGGHADYMKASHGVVLVLRMVALNLLNEN